MSVQNAIELESGPSDGGVQAVPVINKCLTGGVSPDNDDMDILEMDAVDTVTVTNKRLTGGANPDNDDSDILEINTEGTYREREKLHGSRAVFHYIKILCLSAMCLAIIVIFMFKEEMGPEFRAVNVVPNKTRVFATNLRNVADMRRILVRVYGPFTPSNHVDEKTKTLNVQILRLKNEEHMYISNRWKVPLEDDLEKDNAIVRKSQEFELLQLNGGGYSNIMYIAMSADFHVIFRIEYLGSPIDTQVGIIVGSIILLFLYAMIIWEIIDRTFASVIAAMLALAACAAMNERPNLRTILSWIDTETIVLLFGMMILVAILSESGIFDYMAVLAYKLARGRIWPLLNVLSIFTVIFSAVLDNVTLMLLLTPVIIRICEVTRLNPIPILMSMVIFSNIGAASTPVGDPPNLIITSNVFVKEAGVNFGNFCAHLIPGVVLCYIQTYIMIRIKYNNVSKLELQDPTGDEEQRQIDTWERAAANMRGVSTKADVIKNALQKEADELKTTRTSKQPGRRTLLFEETLVRLKEEYPIRDKVLLVKATISFVFVLSLFFMHSAPHIHYLTLGWSALLGALLLLVITDIEDFGALMGRVEWNTLIFFASLFVLMEALTRLGLIELLSKLVIKLVAICKPEMRLAATILIVLWIAGIASAFLDNIPVATMMVRIIVQISDNQELKIPLQPLVWALAFGCCFGGNGTVIGASANVVSAGIIQQHGYKFGFVEFFVVGFPIMIGSLLVISGYLMVCHIAFTWH